MAEIKYGFSLSRCITLLTAVGALTLHAGVLKPCMFVSELQSSDKIVVSFQLLSMLCTANLKTAIVVVLSKKAKMFGGKCFLKNVFRFNMLHPIVGADMQHSPCADAYLCQRLRRLRCQETVACLVFNVQMNFRTRFVF